MREMKFFSRGGQGAVTVSKVMVQAAIFDGKFAQSIPSYGQERQGAPVFCFARISGDYIHMKSYVEAPDCVVIFDAGLKNSNIDVLEGIQKNTTVIINTDNSIDEYLNNKNVEKVIAVDARKITAQQVGNVPFNMAMLGALAKAEETVSIGSVVKAIQYRLQGKVGKRNAEAAKRAYEEATAYTREKIQRTCLV